MLLIPGPVDVPDPVLRASAYVINHRSPEFREIVKDCEEMLNNFANSTRTVITTGSGTTAVESMIFSLTRPNEKVLTVSFGEFGDRMIESLVRRGTKIQIIKKSVNDVLTEEEVEKILSEDHGIDSLFLVQNETGNGTSIRNLREITKIAKQYGVKVFIDSVSAFGAVPINLNEWGIDAMATCSQKGLASVPGLGIVSLGKELSDHIPDGKDIPQYLDLSISLKFLDRHETPYTPSTGSFNALRTALWILEKEGIENRWRRISSNANFLREYLSRSGADIIGNENNYSDTVIAFKPSNDINKVIDGLADKGIIVSKGMGPLNKDTIRIGNLGMINGMDIMKFLNTYFEITGSTIKVDESDIPPESMIDGDVLENIKEK